MSRFRRARVPGASYFFTVVLADRRSDLLTRHIDLLRETVRATQLRHPFHIDAWVTLPDHLHCIWTLPEGDANFALRWKVIKFGSSKRLPVGEGRTATQRARDERGIWQRRYWEHLIRDEQDYQRHVEYIHFNPVKHGHVGAVEDWPYSSFHRAVRMGLYPQDWGRDFMAETGRWGGIATRGHDLAASVQKAAPFSTLRVNSANGAPHGHIPGIRPSSVP